MNEYTLQAKRFLENCNAKMTINYMGLRNSNWDVGYMYEVLTFNGNQFQAFEDELF